MPLHLIIDGYNLIRQSPELQGMEAGGLEAGREALLSRLAAYRQSRSPGKITVVFDGWQGGGLTESRDRYRGIIIVYSRRGERADEVIKRLLAQERERAVVVSSDREIQTWAAQVGAAWVAAASFETLYLNHPEGAAPDEADKPGAARARKKGPARRLPKQQRRRQQRLKKL
jgi:predicted RNA-binding protein with PIN domain